MEECVSARGRTGRTMGVLSCRSPRSYCQTCGSLLAACRISRCLLRQVQSYEEAFAKIQASTGIQDIDQVRLKRAALNQRRALYLLPNTCRSSAHVPSSPSPLLSRHPAARAPACVCARVCEEDEESEEGEGNEEVRARRWRWWGELRVPRASMERPWNAHGTPTERPQLVKLFIENEDENFKMFNYLNELNMEIEKGEEVHRALFNLFLVLFITCFPFDTPLRPISSHQPPRPLRGVVLEAPVTWLAPPLRRPSPSSKWNQKSSEGRTRVLHHSGSG